MIYRFKSMDELAAYLRKCKPLSDMNKSAVSALEMCASVVERTQLEDPSVVEEYALEYAGAQYAAGEEVWSSMRKHEGDPRWRTMPQLTLDRVLF